MRTTRRHAFCAALTALASLAIASLPAGPRAAGQESMDDRCRAEVLELHEFFVGWMGGKLPSDPGVFRRLDDALAVEFEMVSADGVLVTRDQLLAGLMSAHGVHAGRTRPFRIRIVDYRGHPVGPETHLVTYQEWQVIDGVTRGRLSTALFRNRKGAPNGVEWVHLHETWMPEPSSGADP